MTSPVSSWKWSIDISKELVLAQRQMLGPKSFGATVAAKLTAADLPYDPDLKEVKSKLVSATTYVDTDKALEKLYDWGDEHGLEIVTQRKKRRHR